MNTDTLLQVSSENEESLDADDFGNLDFEQHIAELSQVYEVLDQYRRSIEGWDTLSEEAKRLEKKQITDACWYGHDIKHEYFNPIHYFDQTYNQN